ncbi:MAG: hypothetical protein BWY91_02604 [bacterium ADurb.BinA028]|nr:MAG: hypothetical protein BWY91_02604 [bacterium ADurb.BinA028]
MPALDQLVRRPGHVVAQVVEAELVVRAVGDVLGIFGAALVGGHRGEDAAGLQPEHPVDAAHQLRLVLGQVVVDRDDVNALARERVEVGRQGRDEGLALTGAHFGDVALVQGDPAHDLHVEVPLAEGPLGGLPNRGEGLGKDGVERLALSQAPLERVGLGAQLGVGQLLEVLLEDIDLGRHRFEPLDDPALAGTQQLLEHLGHKKLLERRTAVGSRRARDPG